VAEATAAWLHNECNWSVGSRGGNAWQQPSHTFFMFCFKMSLKLFQNGYFFGCIPTPFLLALHPWLEASVLYFCHCLFSVIISSTSCLC